MKKFALILLVAVLCVPIFAFAACADPSDDPYDLSTKEIGYEIPVYPDCEFSYVVKWEEWDPETREDIEKSCTVKITDMKATLTAKNTISEGEVLDESFSPYEITVSVTGHTDVSFVGLEIYCYISCNDLSNQSISLVDNNGNIYWEDVVGINNANHISFYRLYSLGRFK